MATYEDAKWHISNGRKNEVKEHYEHLKVLRHLMMQGHMDAATLQAFRHEEARIVGAIQQVMADEIEVREEEIERLRTEADRLAMLVQEAGAAFPLPPPLPQ